jgi:primosomal protein N' (replication factor Y)
VNTATVVADGMKKLAGEGIRVRGPAPCPISRISGKHRQQVEVIAPTAAALQQLLALARNRALLKPGASMAVDVDPIALL